MTFEAPLALGALVVLPMIWFWHRRRNRPRTVDLPSLQFLQVERDVPPARRQALDPDLWFALGAALLAVVAAAGPRRFLAPGGRSVRVVVSQGAPGGALGYAERVQESLSRLEAALGDGDRPLVPEEPSPDPPAHRPSDGDLLGASRAGEASWRAVISDVPAPDDAPGVHWGAVGTETAFNVGLVAASLQPQGAGVEVFGNVQGDAQRPVAVLLVLDAGVGGEPESARLDLPPGGNASHAFSVSRIGHVVTLELLPVEGRGAWEDDLRLDDRVTWERRPFGVAWGPGVPSDVRDLVRSALTASLGVDGHGETRGRADLLVAVPGDAAEAAAWVLRLHPAPDDAPLAPPGSDRTRPSELVRDLSTTGVDLRYGPGVAVLPEDDEVLLWRETRSGRWPVVARRGRQVYFLPDPRRGSPPPSRAPLWPLFLDNLVRSIVGEPVGGDLAYRRTGLLDPASSTLGTSATPLDVDTIAAAPEDRAVTWQSARPWLVAGALACLLLLWLRPRSARRTRPVSGRRAVSGRRVAPSSVPSTG